MKTGLNHDCGGRFNLTATFERNFAMLARTDALRRRRAIALAASVEHATARAVPLETILPFAILGGDVLVHDHLSRRSVFRSFARAISSIARGSGKSSTVAESGPSSTIAVFRILMPVISIWRLLRVKY
jgi:uncharacterized membrane protein